MIETKVQGGSMEPFLRNGQGILLTRKLSTDGIRPGDILALRSKGGTVVLHRFLYRSAAGHFVTQGDHCIRPDKPWRREQLVGGLFAVRDEHLCWRKPVPSVHRAAASLLKMRWLPGRIRQAMLRRLSAAGWTSLSEVPPHEKELLPLPAVWAQEAVSRWETQELGTELAVFDRKTGAVHMLNPQAALIWRKCLAGASEGEITESLTGEYPTISRSELTRDVTVTMETLLSAELIEAGPQGNYKE